MGRLGVQGWLTIGVRVQGLGFRGLGLRILDPSPKTPKPQNQSPFACDLAFWSKRSLAEDM